MKPTVKSGKFEHPRDAQNCVLVTDSPRGRSLGFPWKITPAALGFGISHGDVHGSRAEAPAAGQALSGPSRCPPPPRQGARSRTLRLSTCCPLSLLSKVFADLPSTVSTPLPLALLFSFLLYFSYNIIIASHNPYAMYLFSSSVSQAHRGNDLVCFVHCCMLSVQQVIGAQ